MQYTKDGRLSVYNENGRDTETGFLSLVEREYRQPLSVFSEVIIDDLNRDGTSSYV